MSLRGWSHGSPTNPRWRRSPSLISVKCQLLQIRDVQLDGTMLVVTGFQFWLVFIKGQYSPQFCYHGLHGSAGTVLTAIMLSYGKWRNSTPRRIKTPSLVEMKLWTYDYVREICSQIYFCKNSCSGGFWRKWWNITSQIFFYTPTFFFSVAPTSYTCWQLFACCSSKNVESLKEVPFGN